MGVGVGVVSGDINGPTLVMEPPRSGVDAPQPMLIYLGSISLAVPSFYCGCFPGGGGSKPKADRKSQGKTDLKISKTDSEFGCSKAAAAVNLF